MDGLLGTIENLRMEQVAGENVSDAKEIARYGLAKPARAVSLVTKDGATRTLEIGAAAPDPTSPPSPLPSPSPAPGQKPEKPKPTKYYARQAGSGLVAVVPATLADDLAKGMGELRAKRLLEVATYDTEGFEVAAAAAKKTYAKSTTKDKDGFDKTQWKRTAPDAKELETSKVEDALFKMGGVEASEFVDQPAAPATYGLDAPALKPCRGRPRMRCPGGRLESRQAPAGVGIRRARLDVTAGVAVLATPTLVVPQLALAGEGRTLSRGSSCSRASSRWP